MSTSAALPGPLTHHTHAPCGCGGGAAEAPTRETTKPRPVLPTPDGAQARRSHNPLKETTTYVEAYQQRRHRHRAHVQHVGQEGQGPAGAREGQQEVTAPAIEPPVDLAALQRDIAAVLAHHGVTGHDDIHIDAREITQAGHTAGVSVTAYAYTRPTDLPAPQPAPDTSFGELAKSLLGGAS